MDYDVFISYSRKDTAVADRICAAFDRAGITYFIDRQGIGGGLEFPEILAEAIVGCRKVLFLASANSYASKFTNSEITFAFNKKEKNSIIPYCIDDCEMPIGLQFVFSGINWRTLREHPIEPVLVDDVLGMLGRQRLSVPIPASSSKRVPETSVRPDASAGSPIGTVAVPPVAAGTYEIGDYYDENGKRGIVFEVDDTGRHGKIMGLQKSEERLVWSLDDCPTGADDTFEGRANQSVVERIGNWRNLYPAFAWCAEQGAGWYLPAKEELLSIYRKKKLLAKSCAAHSGDRDIEWYYWSSVESNYTGRGDWAWAVDLLEGKAYEFHHYKQKKNFVRAVAEF